MVFSWASAVWCPIIVWIIGFIECGVHCSVICYEHCTSDRQCYGTAGNSLVIPCGSRRESPYYTYTNVTNRKHQVILSNSSQWLSLILERFHDNNVIVCAPHSDGSDSGGVYLYHVSVCYAPVDYIPDLTSLQTINTGNYLHEGSLPCPILSNPVPTCTWRILSCVNIYPNPPAPYYGVHYEDNGCTIVIHSLTVNYTRLCFECIGTNFLGSATHNYTSFQLTSCNEELVQFMYYEGVQLPDNSTLTVYVGDDVTLSCEGFGTDFFNKLFWLINFDQDNAIPPENYTFDELLCKSTAMLRLINVTVNDSGFYTCGYGAVYANDYRITVQLEVQTRNGTVKMDQDDVTDRSGLYIIIPTSITAVVIVVLILVMCIVCVGATVISRRRLSRRRSQTQEYALLSNYGTEEVYDVFLSFAEQDNVFVETQLKLPLERHGYSVCWHHDHFQPGTSVLDNIERSVYQSRFTIAVISNSFIMSEFCLRELSVVSRKTNDTTRNCLIPVVMENSSSGIDILESFKVTYINYNDKKLLTKLTSTLGKPLSHD